MSQVRGVQAVQIQAVSLLKQRLEMLPRNAPPLHNPMQNEWGAAEAAPERKIANAWQLPLLGLLSYQASGHSKGIALFP